MDETNRSQTELKLTRRKLFSNGCFGVSLFVVLLFLLSLTKFRSIEGLVLTMSAFHIFNDGLFNFIKVKLTIKSLFFFKTAVVTIKIILPPQVPSSFDSLQRH